MRVIRRGVTAVRLSGQRIGRLLKRRAIIIGPVIGLLILAGLAFGLVTVLAGQKLSQEAVKAVSGSPLQTLSWHYLLATTIVASFFGLALYLFIDYRQHRVPLKRAAQGVRYGFLHHIKVVNIPLLKYKWKPLSYSVIVGASAVTTVFVFGALGLYLYLGRAAQAANLDITIKGSGSSGFVAYTERPLFRGTGPANSTLQVKIDGSTVGDAVVGSDGKWSFQAPTNLGLGDHTLDLSAHETGQYVYFADNDNFLGVLNVVQARKTARISLPGIFAGSSGMQNNDHLTVVPAKHKVYVATSKSDSYDQADYNSGTLSIIDTDTGTISKDISLPFHADRVLANTNGQNVVVSGRTYDTSGEGLLTKVAVIDSSSDNLVGSIITINDVGWSPTNTNSKMGNFSTDNTKFLLRTENGFHAITLSNAGLQTIDLSGYKTAPAYFESTSQVILTNTADIVFTPTATAVVKIDISPLAVVDEIAETTGFTLTDYKISDDDSTLWSVRCLNGFGNPATLVTTDLTGGPAPPGVQTLAQCNYYSSFVVSPSGQRAYATVRTNTPSENEIQVIDLVNHQLLSPISRGSGQYFDDRLYPHPSDANQVFYLTGISNYENTGEGLMYTLNLNTGTTTATTTDNPSAHGVNNVAFTSVGGDQLILYNAYTENSPSNSSFQKFIHNLNTGEDIEISGNGTLFSSVITDTATISQESLAERSIDFTVASVKITDPVSNTTVVGTSYTARGKALAGQEVDVLVNDQVVGTATANNTNDWSVDLTNLTPGQKKITARLKSDTYGFPIIYPDYQYTTEGFQFYNFNNDTIELHDDIDFGGGIPFFMSGDGNTALTFSFADYTMEPITFHIYNLTTREDEGVVSVPTDLFDGVNAFLSPDGNQLYLVNIDQKNQYRIIDLKAGTASAAYNLTTQSPFHLSSGNRLMEMAQTPDKQELFMPGGVDNKVHVLNMGTNQETTFDTAEIPMAIYAPSDDFIVVMEGQFEGTPGESDFQYSRYEYFDRHTHQLLGVTTFTPIRLSKMQLYYMANSQKLLMLPTPGTFIAQTIQEVSTSSWDLTDTRQLEDGVKNNSSDSYADISTDGSTIMILDQAVNRLRRFNAQTGQELAEVVLPGIARMLQPVQQQPGIYIISLVNGDIVTYNSSTNTLGNVVQTDQDATIGLMSFGGGTTFKIYTGFISDSTEVSVNVVESATTEEPSTPTNPSGGGSGGGGTTTPTKPRVPTQPRTATPPQPSPGAPEPASEETPQLQELKKIAALPEQKKVLGWASFVSERTSWLVGWLLALVLALLGAWYANQARRAYRARQIVHAAIGRTKNMVAATDNYLAITTHYLATPAAIMSGSIELLSSLQKIPGSVADMLKAKLQAYSDQVARLTHDQEGLSAQATSVTQTVATTNVVQRTRVQPVWIASGVSVLLFGLATWLFNSQYPNRQQGIQLILQIAAVVAAVGAVVLGSYLKRTFELGEQVHQQALSQEQALMEARLQFIQHTRQALDEHVENLTISAQHILSIPEAKTFMNGLAMLTATKTSLDAVQRFGRVGADPPALSVEQELSSVIKQLEEEAQQKQVTVTSRLSSEAYAQLQPAEFRQLTSSLIDNAIRASKAGGAVLVTSEVAHHHVVIRVTDSGSGIPTEQLAHLFEPFLKTQSVETYDQAGLGLSLHTDKILVEKLGGALHITNRSGGQTGVVAELVLPASSAGAASAPQIVAPAFAST